MRNNITVVVNGMSIGVDLTDVTQEINRNGFISFLAGRSPRIPVTQIFEWRSISCK